MTLFIGSRSNKLTLKSRQSMNSFIGIRVGSRISGGASPYDLAYPIITDGNSVAWYLADDLTTITKDGSNLVSRWNDKLVSGHDLLQATGTNQPLWVTPGTIRFDGIDNFMQTAAFVFNQPCTMYILFKQITWTAEDYIIDGLSGYNVFAQKPAGASPQLILFAGTAVVCTNADLAINTWGVATIVFNGASSSLKIDTNAEVTGNPGANNAGGIVISKNHAAASRYSNIEVKEMLFRSGSDLVADKTIIYNYFESRKP